MAPTSAAPTSVSETTRGSTPLAMLPGHLGLEDQKAMKLNAAAQTTAMRGERTRVETTVAIELAASWKPLMKSNASASAIIATSAIAHQRTPARPPRGCSPRLRTGRSRLRGCRRCRATSAPRGPRRPRSTRCPPWCPGLRSLGSVEVGEGVPVDLIGLVLQPVDLDAEVENLLGPLQRSAKGGSPSARPRSPRTSTRESSRACSVTSPGSRRARPAR